MKPGLTFKYYRRNKRKLALLVIPLTLSILMLYLVYMLIASYDRIQYNAFIETRKYYSSIQARSNLITEDIVQNIKNNENTDKVVPCVLGYTEIDGVVSTVGVRVYLLYRNDLEELIGKMGLEIQSGRLPVPGSGEIVLHESVIKNKNLTIGDFIGSDIISNEKLVGRHRIVGSLKGEAIAGFAPLEDFLKTNGMKNPSQYGILVYPVDGRLAELNRYLAYLPMNGNDLSNYDTSLAELSRSVGNINIILNIIYLSVLVIVALCLGFLTDLFYRGRRKEFAILHVMGYSRQRIILWNIFEVFLINALSALAGIAGAVLVGLILNIVSLNAMGTPLLLFDSRTVVLSLCVPMLCIIGQTLSIGFSLSNTDMVSMIDLESGGAL